jgi:hypothetical protein
MNLYGKGAYKFRKSIAREDMVIQSPALFLAFPTCGQMLIIFIIQKMHRTAPPARHLHLQRRCKCGHPPQIRQAMFSMTGLVFMSDLGRAGEGRAYPSILSRHSLTHPASIRTSRAFFKFSFMIQSTSLSGLTSHFSISALPSTGRATTATLQQ